MTVNDLFAKRLRAVEAARLRGTLDTSRLCPTCNSVLLPDETAETCAGCTIARALRVAHFTREPEPAKPTTRAVKQPFVSPHTYTLAGIVLHFAAGYGRRLALGTLDLDGVTEAARRRFERAPDLIPLAVGEAVRRSTSRTYHRTRYKCLPSSNSPSTNSPTLPANAAGKARTRR